MKTYVERLETSSDSSRPVPAETAQNTEPLHITEKEIEAALKSTKKGTAGGPDEWGLKQAKCLSLKQLSLIFNDWWVHGVPHMEKECITTLLYKSGDKNDVGNWRPITIGNILSRLFAKIRDTRI